MYYRRFVIFQTFRHFIVGTICNFIVTNVVFLLDAFTINFCCATVLVFRRSLLSQVDSRYAEETLLKESAQALVKATVESAKLPPRPSVDISIDIEVLPSGSPLFGEEVTLFTSMEDHVDIKEREAFSEYQASVEARRRSSSLKVATKSRRRQSSKPTVTQLFQLEVSCTKLPTLQRLTKEHLSLSNRC